VELKAKVFDIIAGKPIVVLNEESVKDLEIENNKIKITYNNKQVVAQINKTKTLVEKNEIGIYKDVANFLKLKDGEKVYLEKIDDSISLKAIKTKLSGRRLNYEEIFQIVKDVVESKLSDIEITALLVALNSSGMTIDEAAYFAMAMAETGKVLNFKNKFVLDKHSIGGLPGDKTSLILVPIIASLGYKIPKTSSKAITSAAGTADKASVLMNVELSVEEMKEVVEKANGCLVWGGYLNLAPADDIFIRYEYALGIDPMMLASIMAKKKAVGSTHLVIDIPTGAGAKVKTIGDAEILAKDFLEISKILKIKTSIIVTRGTYPLGYSVGPSLEAREALEILMRRKNVKDMLDKVLNVANSLLKLIGVENGYEIAKKAILNGSAERKMREIIELQGGNKNVKPNDLPIAKYYLDFKAEKNGTILWMDNGNINVLARILGSPKDLSAGIIFYKKVGEKVKKGETIARLFSNSNSKLDKAVKFIEESGCIGVGETYNPTIKTIEESYYPSKTFILER